MYFDYENQYLLSTALWLAVEDIQRANTEYTSAQIYSHYLMAAQDKLLESLKNDERQDN